MIHNFNYKKTIKKQLLTTILMGMAILSLTCCSPLGLQYSVVQQGTLFTQEQADQLTLGMTKEEVMGILGDPLTTQTFDPDRLEYVYTLEERGIIVKSRRITIEFTNNQVSFLKES